MRIRGARGYQLLSLTVLYSSCTPRAVEAFYEPAPGAQLKSMMKRIDADAWKTVRGV